jgi:hypothetical protein
MTSTEAAVIIREGIRNDPDLGRAVRALLTNVGADDLYEWVEAYPDMAIKLAEEIDSVKSQISEFERRLAAGDLS